MADSMQVPPPQPPRPAVPFSRGATTGDTVYVACKLPSGIVLRVFQWQEYMEPLRDGTMKESRRAIPVEGAQFVCRGPWIATAGQAYNFSSAVTELLPGGYAITEGCPKDVWDGWHMQNKTSDLVKNQVVLAHKDRATLITECKQLTSVVTGLEPLDRNNPSAKMGGVDRRLRLGILEQGEGNR